MNLSSHTIEKQREEKSNINAHLNAHNSSEIEIIFESSKSSLKELKHLPKKISKKTKIYLYI